MAVSGLPAMADRMPTGAMGRALHASGPGRSPGRAGGRLREQPPSSFPRKRESILVSRFRGGEGAVTTVRGGCGKDPFFSAMDSRFRGNDGEGRDDGLREASVEADAPKDPSVP